jgi:hypothetical protein
MKLHRLRLSVVAIAGTLAAILFVSPAIGGPSLKELIDHKVESEVKAQLNSNGLKKAKGLRNAINAQVNRQLALKTGPAGPAGDTGAPGASGSGLDFSYDEELTEESTTSTTHTDLATVGPTVTVTVPSDGLLFAYAGVDIRTSNGMSSCQVSLAEDGVVVATTLLFSYSTTNFATVVSSQLLVLPRPAGTHAYKLVYRATGGATCDYKNRKLWVAVSG